MRFENFRLEYQGGVELHALGHNWDLHNGVDFSGLRYDALSGQVVLEWVALPKFAPNPWGDASNTATGCRLRFCDVTLLRLGPRNESYPSAEATCVETIETITDPEQGDSLQFTMQDERVIEIRSGSVLLERET